MATASSSDPLARRLVRYADLRPCTTAFIDSRTPGSERKENFTIIGPGVAENPEQYVHISEPHGFNVGGARQPPGCVNSQHSHETAEVFIVLSGRWRFMTGEAGRDGSVELGPGDTISLPTHAFRGFENVGTDTGFLFAVLGGDDPGRVLWSPYVFEAARQHGLVLLENGRLIDTLREAVPAGARRMPATTSAEVARLRTLDSSALVDCVVKLEAVLACGQTGAATETPIICTNASAMPHSRLSWPHGFTLHALQVPSGTASEFTSVNDIEVVLMHSHALELDTGTTMLELRAGDTLSIPRGTTRRFVNRQPRPALAFVVRPTAVSSQR
jgi:quercetin dioxygenase-like cupin family protein